MPRSDLTPPANTPSNLATVLIPAAFVLTGVMTTLLGPMLPVLSARWALNDTHAGYLFTAQFASSMVGVLLSGLVVQRYGYRLALVLGLGAMATGAAILAHAPWMAGIAAVCGYGVGLGLAIPAANLLTAELNPSRRAAALNWLNFSWGVGAMGCPFAVATLAGSHRTSSFLLGMSAALSLMAISFLFAPRLPMGTPRAKQESGTSSSVWRSRFVLLLGSLFFLYVGTENCIGGWVASYAKRIQISPGTFWALTPSFFWGALLAGRALAPTILRYMEEKKLASIGLFIASCGVTILLAVPTMEALLVGSALAGFGLASVFPTNIALLSLRFGVMAPRVGGLMFALAGLGGATLPSLVGSVSTRFGTLKAGLGIPLLGCLTMLVLYYLVGRSSNEGLPA